MNQALPNHRNKIYGGAWPVPDPDILEYLMTTSINSTHNEFVNDYFQWFANPHNINGIEKFNSLSYCNGTTEAFDKFYHKHMHRKLRFLRGEYFYHQIMAKRFFKESSFIDDPNDISNNDVVVMSVPFSDTGNVPEHYDNIMTQCEKITTSLSKVFPVAHWRIGMRMQKENIDDTLDAYEMNSYLNTHAVNVGHQLIKQYPADYSFNKYRQQQLSFCNMLDLTPSDSFIFGIDYKNKSQEYNRGGPSNRFCFAKHFQ